MKLNYKLWDVICTPTELKKSYNKHPFRSVIYFTTDYVVATEGHMLVAIPACKAFTLFNRLWYDKMVGSTVNYIVAKEIYKEHFIIDLNQIKTPSGAYFPLEKMDPSLYPNWK